jgi:hypothetical protein
MNAVLPRLRNDVVISDDKPDVAVAFLTESIGAQQLEQLAALMDEKKCESVELY